jgi:hypothetical protein
MSREVTMLAWLRHRFASIHCRADRVKAPGPGRKHITQRAPLLIVGAIIASALGSASPALRPVLAASQPPIGFERWTVPEAKSGVAFGLTAAQVFQQYAQPMVAPGLTPTYGTKDKRLIDVEVRADPPGVANYVYDVVWVKVEDHFDLESWFVPKLSEAELHMLPQLAPQGIVAVDIERYPEGGEWIYAAILERNAEKVGWDVVTDASLDDVLDTAERRGMRVLDLDYAIPGPLDCTIPGQACAPATFDAILVANSGSNAIETKVWLDMSPAQIADKQDQGFQMIDREDEGDSVVTVWVKAGMPFEILDDLSDNEVLFEHNHHGRVVDLEGTPDAFSIVRFDESAAPASPGFAAPRQGGNDGEAKGKTERDRKAKHHKAGKRGKGTHR